MNERGFTLIEVLVALALTALVAGLAYGALSSTIAASESAESEAVRLQSLERTFRLLQRDLGWIVKRPGADNSGAAEPVFSGSQPGLALMSLTRGGWSNPRQQRRSDLQRVRYRWQNQRLQRDYWVNTDRGAADVPVTTVLLEGLNGIELRYLDASQGGIGGDSAGWRKQWLARDGQDRLPAAVEVVLDLEVWGEVRRLFVLPADG